jgi:hypothetical protein
MVPTGGLNAFSTLLFNGAVLGPVDHWTLQIEASDNPSMVTVSASDVRQVDLREIEDVVLALDYEVTPS